ncbi:hypothetical protein EV356DRAFT_529912 [Viridothelium virens]|uniref:Uncharacterized protein n=1 Tax=Viridothelium virens TaxID=1048519 RepID=A0A6A6HHG8_VIRVR|nr:hypothetical protein EV356DRAFT_529912 [Viridothelium virens]
MLAAAHDQENLAHARQTAAAAKPLNHGTRGAKTPANKGPKTPFRIPLNDENAPLKTGKSVLKANVQHYDDPAKDARDGKSGKGGSSNTLVTPAGPRNRAPLGMKTTNAKAKAFQTPAPLSIDHAKEKSIPKSLSPRMRRAKVKVHHEGPNKVEAGNEEPEIEYMPPQPKPLRDDPDDYPADKQYPMFSPENITRGLYATFSGADDEDFIAKREKEEAEAQAEHEKNMDDLLQSAIDNDPVLNFFDTADTNASTGGKLADKQLEAKKKRSAPTQEPSISVSKSAASALSRPSKPHTSTRPTASSTQKAKTPTPTAPSGRKQLTTATSAAMNPSSLRTTSGNVTASRTTLGYAQGRTASSNLRRPLQDVMRDQTPVSGERGSSTTVKPKKPASSSRPTSAMAPSARRVAIQKENQRPAAATSSAADPEGVEAAAVDAWLREHGDQLGLGGPGREEDGDGSEMRQLPMLDDMLREEALQEWRFDL